MTGASRPLRAAVDRLRGGLRGIGHVARLPLRYPLGSFFGLFGVAVCVNILDSFGLAEAGNQLLSDSIDAVSGPVYGLELWKARNRVGQNAIVVVLLDQKALDALEADGLPLPYDRQARVLETVTGFQPRAIFLDVFYPRAQRSAEAALLLGVPDPRLSALTAALTKASRTRPVFIGPVADNPALAPLRKVLAAPGADGKSGVREVALAVDPVNPRAYAVSGPAEPGQPGSRLLPTAATALYSAWCARTADARCRNPPLTGAGRDMRIRWGFGGSDFMAPKVPDRCLSRGLTGVVSYLWAEATRALHGDAQRGQSAGYRCAYADYVFYASLDPELNGGVDIDALKCRLRNSIVLIGVDLPSSGDRRRVPFYREVAGVMTHAMALDNFIETGGRPALAPRQLLYGLDELEALQYLAALLCFGFGLYVVPALRPLYRSRDRKSERELLVAGATTFAFLVLGTAIVALAWNRQWPLSALVLGGFIPGGVLSVVFATRSYAGTRRPVSRRRRT